MAEILDTDRRVDRGRDVAAFEQRDPLRVRVPRRRGIHDAAAADRRSRAQHDAVAARRDDRRGKPQLRVAVACTGNARRNVRRAVVDVHPRRDLPQRLERDVEPVADGKRVRRHERVAAAEVVALDARQAHGNALAGLRALDRPVVHLDAPHADVAAERLDAQLVPLADRPRPERAGDDRADASERENAVDPQARRTRSMCRAHPVCDGGEGC